MKSLLRNTLINAFALFLISQAISGIKISGGFESYLLAGLALSLLFLVLKPILNIISIPLNIATLGFFSVVTNIVIYYLLTVFVPSVSISDFTYPGFSYAGFIIPKIFVNIFFSFLLISAMQSFIFSFISWIMKK